MHRTDRYPYIGIRTKYELAKRIASAALPYPKALALINDALVNFDRYWYDSKDSKPAEEKFVRSAVGNSLGKLLQLIDRRVLAPHDNRVPGFIFGGLSGKDHIQAARHLLGIKRERRLLRLDIKRFFEQIHEERVFHLFYSKCGCSVEGARLLAQLCCVPSGAKGSTSEERGLARGFATSPRLSLWCNLDTFLRVHWKASRQLKNHDPRVVIFVDDVGVTASRVTHQEMEILSKALEDILAGFDHNQPLRINVRKKEILAGDKLEHLGIRLGRNKLSLGAKSRSRMEVVKNRLKGGLPREERTKLKRKLRSYKAYKRQVQT